MDDFFRIAGIAGPYIVSIGTVLYFVIREMLRRSGNREDSLLKNQFTKEDYLKYREEDDHRHKAEIESLNSIHEQQVKLLNQSHEDRVKNLLSIHETENNNNLLLIKDLNQKIDDQNLTIEDLQKQITKLKPTV